MKRLTFIVLVLASTACWSQAVVTGTVIFKDDGISATGINVVEKGTSNGTVTGNDGTFKLTVNEPDAILVFSHVGFQTQEFQVTGKKEILIRLKPDCNKDFFDSRVVYLSVSRGMVNNPVGMQIDFASPWIFRGVVKGSYGYQTNLYANKMQTAQVELAHYISTCDYDLDFRWSNRQVAFDYSLDFRVNSFETDVNIGSTKLIVGYSHLNYTRLELADNKKLSGVVMGIGKYFNVPLRPAVIAKVALYQDKVEYQASIQGSDGRLLYFLKYYKLDTFTELSLGFGFGIGYGKKKRKE